MKAETEKLLEEMARAVDDYFNEDYWGAKGELTDRGAIQAALRVFVERTELAGLPEALHSVDLHISADAIETLLDLTEPRD